ncbi:MAG: undecaprenyl diphosphate synthase family protein, partial [Bacteroidales bacterium]
MSLKEQIQKENLPQHIAIIMDGNGRWATMRQLDRTQGHIQGAKAVR